MYAHFAAALQELRVDPEVIAEVVAVLENGSNTLQESEIRRLRLAESVFGGSEEGARLGYHHAKAQTVIADTIEGIAADLQRFSSGVKEAVAMVEDADTTSAADLKRATGLIVAVAAQSEGDRRNRESRNENLTPGEGE